MPQISESKYSTKKQNVGICNVRDMRKWRLSSLVFIADLKQEKVVYDLKKKLFLLFIKRQSVNNRFQV